MKIRAQFGIRSLLVAILLVGLGIVVWQSIPKPGSPVLYGRIVDTHGDPIPDVEIILHSGFATRWPGQRAKTDAGGRFKFAPLKTGSAILSDTRHDYSVLVGIRVAHPQYIARDGLEWWDVTVPWIKNRKQAWNLVMIQRAKEPTD